MGHEDAFLLKLRHRPPHRAPPHLEVRHQPALAGQRKIVDARVPVGARSFRVEKTSDFKVNDRIFVVRHGNKEWISAIGMDQIMPRTGNSDRTKQWGPFSLAFERKIVSIAGDQITVDAPIVCAIEARWGGGEIAKYTEERRTRNCGVENLRIISDFDPAIKKTGTSLMEHTRRTLLRSAMPPIAG